ncbi:guanylate cyclase [Elysia marginata]|uniref:Guanylate cyclase n=1 Tax=Elysia marginata TaxID=1093978 RepID=A0AAV4H2W9_9GAST|nr:guanylate cyclase [Elysia marginata]
MNFEKALRVVGLLASFWSTPVITWEPVQRDVVGDKTYDNVFSVYGAFEDFAQSAAVVIRHLGWTKIAFLYEDSPLCNQLMDQLAREMLDRDLATEALKVILVKGNTAGLARHLKQIKVLTRTVVTCSRQYILMDILAEAEKVGMTNGYYAFLHLDFNVRALTTGSRSDGQRSPLDVVLQLGQFHTTSDRRVEEEKQKEGERKNETSVVKEILLTSDEQTSALDSQHTLASYLHDAIVVATVASQEGRKSCSPETLSIGQPYKLKTGKIEFDEQGIRKALFSLVQPFGAVEMVTVAEISSNQNATWIRQIVWPGGHVPKSEITCQGNGTCIDVQGIIAGVTIGVFVLILLLTLIGYFYRKHRRRLAAAKKDWLVDDRDVKRRRAKLPISNGFTSGPGSNMETVKRLVRMRIPNSTPAPNELQNKNKPELEVESKFQDEGRVPQEPSWQNDRDIFT